MANLKIQNISCIFFQGMAKVKFWPFEKNWQEMGGRDEVELPPIDLKDDNAFYYRFKYIEEFGRFEHTNEYKNQLKELLNDNYPEFICSICDLGALQRMDEVENLKLCQPLANVDEADTDDDDFKGGANTKFWGGFVFRKRVKYQIGDAIFVRKSGSDKKEDERMEQLGMLSLVAHAKESGKTVTLNRQMKQKV